MGVYLGQSVYNDSQVTPEWVEEEIAKNGKGVFFATYGQTTYQNILQEYNNGKIIVVKYEPETPGAVTTYYFNLVRFNTETFDFVGVMQDGTIYRTGVNVNEGWEQVANFKLDEIEFVEYNVDSYSTIKSHYANGKFIVLKYRQQTPLVTKYFFYPLVSVDETNEEIVFGSLELGQNNKKVTFTVTDSGGWATPAESPAVVVDAALDSSSHNPVENMAIAAELTSINNKITGDLNDIFLALASKGVTVPAGAGLDDVAGLIEDIPAGGGGDFIKGTTIINGVEYPTVKINGLTWLARNFNLLLDGVPINPGNSTNPAQYYPRNDYRETYGILYNGAAVEYIEQNKDTICPGWHVPTKNEFDGLIDFFNGVDGLCKVLCSSNYNHGIGDVVGFNILAGGNWDRAYDRFEYENRNAYLISIDKDTSNRFYHVSTTNNNEFTFGSNYGEIEYANNLRLVKDL